MFWAFVAIEVFILGCGFIWGIRVLAKGGRKKKSFIQKIFCGIAGMIYSLIFVLVVLALFMIVDGLLH
jgi:hypothetical protein